MRMASLKTYMIIAILICTLITMSELVRVRVGSRGFYKDCDRKSGRNEGSIKRLFGRGKKCADADDDNDDDSVVSPGVGDKVKIT